MIEVKTPKASSNTVTETYEYYKQCCPIEKIAELRNLSESTIYSHIASLILNGLIQLDEIVGDSKKEKVLKVLKENDFKKLVELKEHLGKSISYGEINCVLAFLKTQKDEDVKTMTGLKEEPLKDMIVEKELNEDSLESEIFTVGELTKYIKKILENNNKLNDLFVRGEISNLTYHSSGHVYFSLKDEKTQVKCVLFSRYERNMNFKLEEGMKVILKGSLEVYVPMGEYSIIVKEVQPDGLGTLHLAFTQLKEKLQKEGLFSSEYKKEFPRFPKKIGIITSSTGAALQDILKVLKKRYPIVEVILVPTLVQGNGSAESIVNSIKMINELSDVDLAIVGRGGGSLEDLWSFNEEIVARAIFQSEIPIISAVGHEVDFTISDFVADERAPTPSAAAEMAVPDMKELYEDINHLKIRGSKSLSHKLELYKSDLKQIDKSLLYKKIMNIIDKNHRELDQTKDSLRENLRNILEIRKRDLEIAESKIISLNPMSILGRGYSVVMSGDKIITSSSKIMKGEDINILLHKGRVEAKVKKTWQK